MSIFGPDELPEWMRGLGAENRKVAGQFGQTLGTSMGALALVAGGDKDVDPMTGESQPLSFGAAYQRARLNQADPLGPLKAQQIRLGFLNTAARIEEAHSHLKLRNQETAAWMQDTPEWSKWLNTPPAAREAARQAGTAPAWQSQKAIAMATKVDLADTVHASAQAHADLLRQKAANTATAAKLAAADTTRFLKDLEALNDPELRAQIRALPAHRDGSPSPAQWRALRDALRDAKPAAP